MYNKTRIEFHCKGCHRQYNSSDWFANNFATGFFRSIYVLLGLQAAFVGFAFLLLACSNGNIPSLIIALTGFFSCPFCFYIAHKTLKVTSTCPYCNYFNHQLVRINKF